VARGEQSALVVEQVLCVGAPLGRAGRRVALVLARLVGHHLLVKAIGRKRTHRARASARVGRRLTERGDRVRGPLRRLPLGGGQFTSMGEPGQRGWLHSPRQRGKVRLLEGLLGRCQSLRIGQCFSFFSAVGGRAGNGVLPLLRHVVIHHLPQRGILRIG